MKRAIIFAGLAILLLVPHLHASTTDPLISRDAFSVGQGDLLLNFGVDPHIYRGDASTELVRLIIGANYFVTDVFAPGMEIDYWYAGGSFFRFLPNLRAYWPGLNRVLPYAMIGVGFIEAFGASFFDLAVGPGIDFLLTENVAIGFQVRYDLAVGNGTLHEIRFPLMFALYFDI